MDPAAGQDFYVVRISLEKSEVDTLGTVRLIPGMPVEVLTFPFFTIENVHIVDAKHIIVGNDNNLLFSTSRDPNKADDNEFILLDVEARVEAPTNMPSIRA